MVWVGLRQKRVLARNFGILLQIGAAVSYLFDVNYIQADSMLFVNEVTLGGIFIALGALFSAYQLSHPNWGRHEMRRKATCRAAR